MIHKTLQEAKDHFYNTARVQYNLPEHPSSGAAAINPGVGVRLIEVYSRPVGTGHTLYIVQFIKSSSATWYYNIS